MHAEAHAGFGWALEQTGIDPDGSWQILDIGGQSINGSVHDYFPNSKISTLDLENADIIADATTWEPFFTWDIVIATEVFEHVQKWREILATMRKALDPFGAKIVLITCASTGRPPHGATGAPLPVEDEWYENIDPGELSDELGACFPISGVHYQQMPGDAYAWASL